tara:strand:+ start:9098 stop:9682 length:585 start_codon:yes stop_codon:yes gene_type:complete
MDTLFNQVKPHFDRHQKTSNVEFEIRLGKVNNKMFDTNVGRETFEKLTRALDKYTEWESVKKIHQSVYYKGDTRIVVDENTDDTVCMKKTPIVKENLVLERRPLDVRFAVSLEIPVEQADGDVMDLVRIKNRTSYIRNNLSIDMTTVTGQGDDPDDEEGERFEVELEIIDPLKVKTRDELYNIIHKVHNILEVL